MHTHLYLNGAIRPISHPLADGLRAGNATLVSWSLPNDYRWIKESPGGIVQAASPMPGEIWAYVERGLAQMKAHLQQQQLPLALTSEDVDRSLAGDAHVVLTCEGADFIEGDLAHIAAAYENGLRHLQLVHYIASSIADAQTAAPTHGGLTDFGKQVIVECNRLGVLVDLAHCSEPAVLQALQVSKVPMVWSHSSLVSSPSSWTLTGWRARRLSTATAKALADRGGVVGLWAFGPDLGYSTSAYASTIQKMVEALGEDHVGFGTDLNGLGPSAMMSDYVDLRKVVDELQARDLPAGRLKKVAAENYARVLKAAFDSRQA